MDRVASLVASVALILGASLFLATTSYVRYQLHETGAHNGPPTLNYLAQKMLVAATLAISIGLLTKTILWLS